jgi:PAS domain S-box-containing protein
MKKTQPASPADRCLRQSAEQKLRAQQRAAERPLREIDARALVYELQVHQIELEMQNEELQRAQVEAQQAADKYSELFDFAPVGYFALDLRGLISAVNLVGAALLGLYRERVTGQPFEQYVAPASRAEFSAFCRSVRPGEGRRSCETRLLQHGHGLRDVLVEATLPRNEPGQGHGCRLAVIDITERKRAEEALRETNAELTRFNRAMVDRELRMIELKKEINGLCHRAGQPPRYPSDRAEDQPPPI